MIMRSNLRKFALTAHITSSVGWLGAVAAFLALAIVAQTSQDVPTVRGVYLAMNLTGWNVVVPLCLATLLTGLVMAFGTKWGLFRYYWVAIKFLLTVISALILFGFTNTLSQMGEFAANASLSIEDLRNLRQGPAGHSGGGLLVLLAISALSVYKPWGRTRYGITHSGMVSESNPTTGFPLGERWKFYILLAIALMIIAFLVIHLAQGGGH